MEQPHVAADFCSSSCITCMTREEYCEIIQPRSDMKASEPQFGPFEEVEDEDEGLCEEERALKPLVPARVTACEATGAAAFWANSVPTEMRERI